MDQDRLEEGVKSRLAVEELERKERIITGAGREPESTKIQREMSPMRHAFLKAAGLLKNE